MSEYNNKFEGVPLRDYNEVDQEIIIPEESTKSKKRG